MWMHHSRQALPRAILSLRTFSAQPTANAFESAVHERGGRALSQTQDFVPRTANLCSTRSVLRLAGPDLLTFLQGLVTNGVAPLEDQHARPMYACILNAQGRFLHDLFMHRQPGSEPVLMADVDRETAPDLVKLLRRYKLRAKVDVADVSDEASVWVSFGPRAARQDAWPLDPRLSALGQRAVVAGEPPDPEAAHVIYGRQYCQWRIEHGIAEGPQEIPPGDAIPLEYNLDALHGISYEKGCYVGQELVARTHWSGAVRKRLMPFALRPSADVPVGEAIAAEGGGKRPAGNVRVLNVGSGRGLAVLRLQQGLPAAAGELELHIKSSPHVKVQPWRPSWWPVEWSAQAEQQLKSRAQPESWSRQSCPAT